MHFACGLRMTFYRTMLSLVALLLSTLAMRIDATEAPAVTIRIDETGLYWNEAQLSSVAVLKEWLQSVSSNTRIEVLASQCMIGDRFQQVLDALRESHLPSFGLSTYAETDDSKCGRKSGALYFKRAEGAHRNELTRRMSWDVQSLSLT